MVNRRARPALDPDVVVPVVDTEDAPAASFSSFVTSRWASALLHLAACISGSSVDSGAISVACLAVGRDDPDLDELGRGHEFDGSGQVLPVDDTARAGVDREVGASQLPSLLQSVDRSYEILRPLFLASGQLASQCSPVPPVGIRQMGHLVCWNTQDIDMGSRLDSPNHKLEEEPSPPFVRLAI